MTPLTFCNWSGSYTSLCLTQLPGSRENLGLPYSTPHVTCAKKLVSPVLMGDSLAKHHKGARRTSSIARREGGLGATLL